MSSTLISNIKLLVNTRKENQLLRGKALAVLPAIEDAYLVITDGIIAEYGQKHDIVHHI
jgi:imidazolonepropionase